MSRKLSSNTKKIVALILFFGIVGFIIQVIGAMSNNGKAGNIKPFIEEVVGEFIVS